MTHNIKILENFAGAIVNGDNKTFGVRKNNSGYQKGDIIQFTAINSNGIKIHTHPINDKKYIITDVLPGWRLKGSIVAFSIIPNIEDSFKGEIQ